MSDVVRVSIFGTQPSGEEWSVNPVYAIGGDFGVVVTPAQAQTIATAVANAALLSTVAAGWATGTILTGARLEFRFLNGDLETQAEGIRTTPIAGTGSTAHPYQVAAVSSLRTAFPGASGRGRLYWPATGLLVSGGTLRPAAGTIGTFLGGIKSHLTAVQTAIDATLDGISLVVWSRKLQTTANVTQIQMGDVLDVQRRRRDVLVENVQSLSFP